MPSRTKQPLPRLVIFTFTLIDARQLVEQKQAAKRLCYLKISLALNLEPSICNGKAQCTDHENLEYRSNGTPYTLAGQYSDRNGSI
ncbi:hypothetical protein VTK73DRAFT_6403 [Phialemonium thermophilum]|uniref:Secreted protein n=1 Tax=Phialemonium thermophilum TaxID=223376 RepID=A0ABR3XVH9_9PEZI